MAPQDGARANAQRCFPKRRVGARPERRHAESRDSRPRRSLSGFIRFTSVVLRKQHRGHRAIGFRDDPESGPALAEVRREQSSGGLESHVVRALVFDAQMAPVPPSVTAHGTADVTSRQPLQCLRCGDDTSQFDDRISPCPSFDCRPGTLRLVTFDRPRTHDLTPLEATGTKRQRPKGLCAVLSSGK